MLAYVLAWVPRKSCFSIILCGVHAAVSAAFQRLCSFPSTVVSRVFTAASPSFTTPLCASIPAVVRSTAKMSDLVRLGPHPTSRNAAVAKSLVKAGSTVVSVSALSTCLLPSEKGRRCDGCHILESEEVQLRRCSGCASSWYCGTTCARRHPSAGSMRLHSVQARSEQGVEAPS